MRISIAFRFFGYDILLQYRRGLYLVYIILATVYITGLRQLQMEARHIALLILLFADITSLGFFFLGALIQWEKDEGIYDALYVTPFTPGGFLCVRTASLMLLTIGMSTVVILFTIGIPERPLLLFFTLFMAAAFFTFLGFPVAFHTRNVSSYFITATFISVPLYIPMLDFFGVIDFQWLELLPTGAMLSLFGLILRGGEQQEALKHIVTMSLWTSATLVFAIRNISTRISVRAGGSN